MKMLLLIAFITLVPIFLGARQVLKERRQKRNRLNLAKTYDRLLLEHKLSIEYSEVMGDRILALDKRNKKLLFIDHSEDNVHEVCIDLQRIASSEIVEERGKDERIKKVYLILYNKTGNQFHRLCFFNEKSDLIIDLPAYAKRSMHWKNRIDVHKRLGSASLEQEFIL